MAELQKKSVCVLIPAYNEEKNIGRVIGALKRSGYFVVVSDDGSHDKTVEISKSLGAEVLVSDRNRGKGSSIRQGFDWFMTQPTEALVLMDADGQHDPGELESFVHALNQPERYLVIGDRMSNPKGMPFIRVVTNRFMSWVISRVIGQKIVDSQCGYRALRKELVEKMILKTTRFEIESEMILEASRLGFKISSIPITSVYEGGVSHIQPLQDAFRFFKFLFGYCLRKQT